MLSGALIGLGNIARNGHLPAYLDDPTVASRLRIDAAVDPCPENRAALALRIPGLRTYADADELFRHEQLDFADVCAPPFAHRSLIELALSEGCHVICEKPLATDLYDALAVRERAAACRRVVMPCHQYHYAPQWRALRTALESGRVGPVRLGVVTVLRTGANAGTAGWRPLWRTEGCLAGGGILVDHGTHLFYQLHSVFGAPLEIACHTERHSATIEVDDTATIDLRYPRRLVRVNLTWAAQARYSGHRYVGTRGELLCLDDRLVIRDCRGDEEISFARGLSQGSAHSDWFAPLFVEFADRIERGDIRTDRLDEAVVTAAYISRAYASAAQQGRPIAWVNPLPACAETALAAAD